MRDKSPCNRVLIGVLAGRDCPGGDAALISVSAIDDKFTPATGLA
jgi:hypothetical protein